MNGIIIIDKPSAKTSHDVVDDVKRALSVKKAGHTGTLDPMATGVLPICINEATKLVQFFAMDTKDYTATMLLGVRSDTQDLEGTIISRADSNVSTHDIENAIYRFVGKIEQIPPRYSAIKFHGKALYQWTRKGVAIDPPSRSVEIFDIVIKDMNLPYVTISMSCSKGTYIRTLCSDIGELLGCGACLASLRRTRSGFFHESSAILLDGSSENNLSPKHIIPLIDALPNFPAIYIDYAFAKKLREGYQPQAEIVRKYHIPSLAAGDMVRFVVNENSLVSIAKMLYPSDQINTLDDKRPVVKILRIFNSDR